MTKITEVAAAVLLRDGADGLEFLLAQRPAGKVYAGYWEFPGGKLEAGESFHEALVRELKEELGITVDRAWPWLSREFSYPHATVRLKFFRVTVWRGDITPIEHSGFSWIKVGAAADVEPILPANVPIMRALGLPSLYALTNAETHGVEAELASLKQALDKNLGLRLIQIRDKTLPPSERLRLAEQVMSLTHAYPDVRVLINDNEQLARKLGAHGVHLSSARLAQCAQRPEFDWVAASCHNASELTRAAELGVDFAVLGPVLPTPTHPHTEGIGWTEFTRLVERSTLPVFALGGMRGEMQETAWAHGAHGIALMRAWR